MALRLGATGLESDVWLTSDGVAVLDHDGVVRTGFRKRRLSQFRRAELPEHIPSLEELLDECGGDFALSLDLQDPGAGQAVVDVVREFGDDLGRRTCLCDPDLDRFSAHRSAWPDVRLVHSTRLGRLASGPEPHAAVLADRGIDAVNFRQDDWTGGLVVLFHRFDVHAFAWDLQHEYQLEAAVRMGVDAVYSDHVDTMMDVVSRETG